MFRRVASLSLLAAWLCASGTMLDLTQVVAWTRMFAGYARSESIAAAASETFDPSKPCELCRAVSEARQASSHAGLPEGPQAGKLVLMIDEGSDFFRVEDAGGFEAPGHESGAVRAAEVPVPPPRGAARSFLS